MSRIDHSRDADERILESLWLRDACGWSATQVADRFRMSKGQVIGFWHRINQADREDNGIGNGTMPEKWWKK